MVAPPTAIRQNGSQFPYPPGLRAVRSSHHADMTYLTEQQRSLAIATLCDSTVFPDLIRNLDDLADDLADDFGLPTSAVSMVLADLLRDGVKVLRDNLAGRAEASGDTTITSLAEALGLIKPTNYRRRVPHARDFAEAYRASRLTGVTVPVTVGEWTIEVD